MVKIDFQDHWNELATRWKIRIQAPFTVELSNGPVNVPVLVRDFGNTEGMLLFTNLDQYRPHLNEFVELGFGFSCLNHPSRPYDPESDDEGIQEMLQDWGWTGSSDPPEWYRGKNKTRIWSLKRFAKRFPFGHWICFF